MTRRNYYTLGLWLPVVWPVVIGLGEAFLHTFTWHQMSKVSGLIILSGLFGGVQYLLFSAFISFYFASRDIYYIRRAIWFLPGIFTAICSITVAFFFQIISVQANLLQVRTNSDSLHVLDLSGNIAMFTLIVGYGYLGVLQTVLSLLEAFDLIED